MATTQPESGVSTKSNNEDREEIEELCKMYAEKIKENEEERKTIEIENKELLTDLKSKCDAEHIAVEELLNVKDMIKMVSDLEVERFKKDEEIHKLNEAIKLSHSKQASVTEELKIAKDKIETFKNTVDKLVEGNQQKKNELIEAEKLNSKLKNELQIKSGEIEKVIKDNELNVKKYISEVNSLKVSCSDLKKAKHQVDERLENLYATFKKEKQNSAGYSLELERKNSNLEKAFKEKEQLTDKLLKEIKAVKQRTSSCESLKMESRSSENIVAIQVQEERQVSENLRKEIERLKSSKLNTNSTPNEQIKKTKLDQLELSTNKTIQDLKNKNAKIEKENNLLISKYNAAMKKEATLKEQLVKIQETQKKPLHSDSIESLAKKTIAMSKAEKKYSDLEKLYKEKLSEVDRLKKEESKSKSTVRKLQVLTVAAKLKAKPGFKAQKASASNEDIAKSVKDDERALELEKQVTTDKQAIEKVKMDLEEHKQKLVEAESESRLMQQKHAKEMKDYKSKFAKKIAESEEYEDLTNKTIHTLNHKCETLEAKIQQDALKYTNDLQEMHFLRQQASEIEQKYKIQISEMEKKKEINKHVLKEFEKTKESLRNIQEQYAQLNVVYTETLASKNDDVAKLNEQIISMKTKNENEVKNLETNLKMNEQKQTKIIKEAEKNLSQQQQNHFNEITKLKNEFEGKLTTLQNQLNEKMNDATKENRIQCEEIDFIRKIYEKRLESISSQDFQLNETNAVQRLKRNLNAVQTQLTSKETLLKNIQIQLDYQIQVSEFMMQSLQKELAKQTGNAEILQILLNLSEQFNQFFHAGKDSKRGNKVFSTCDTAEDSCNLSKFMRAPSLIGSQYNTKLEVEKLQRKVNLILNFYTQKFQSISTSDEICQPGESANSPPPFNSSSHLSQSFSTNSISGRFSDGNFRFRQNFSHFHDLDQSFNDSGYIGDSNKKETIEYLLAQIHEQVFILKNENVSSIPLHWFQNVKTWEEKIAIELSKLKYQEVLGKNAQKKTNDSIVYRPSNAEVTSIIKNINEQFAKSHFT